MVWRVVPALHPHPLMTRAKTDHLVDVNKMVDPAQQAKIASMVLNSTCRDVRRHFSGWTISILETTAVWWLQCEVWHKTFPSPSRSWHCLSTKN